MSKTIITIVLALTFTVTSVFAQEDTYINAPTKTIDQMTTQELIELASEKFSQDASLISKISYCESKHKIVAHDGGRAVNMTGIHDRTFNYWLPLYEKEVGETLDIKSTYDQFKMMSWAFSKGESYRTKWTTYVAYKKGGEYSFYSNLLGAHFTVRCK